MSAGRHTINRDPGDQAAEHDGAGARWRASAAGRWRHGGTALALTIGALPLLLAACGRSAPVDSAAATTSEPDIAGVSITSPDAVMSTVPTSATSSTSEPASSDEPQALYTVQPGDTLSVIADQFGVSIEELARYNGINDVNDLSPGQELAIPPQTPVDVSVVDSSEGDPETTLGP